MLTKKNIEQLQLQLLTASLTLLFPQFCILNRIINYTCNTAVNVKPKHLRLNPKIVSKRVV